MRQCEEVVENVKEDGAVLGLYDPKPQQKYYHDGFFTASRRTEEKKEVLLAGQIPPFLAEVF